MRKFEITKEQILELAEKQSGRRAKLKQWFPQAFQSELKTGKWYKSNLLEGKLYCFTKFEQCDGYVRRYYYGFSEDVWRLDYTASNRLDKSWTPATDKEVETALTNEFFSKVKVGNTVKCLNGVAVDIEGKNTVFEKSTNTLLLEDTYHRFEIFKDGKFAEIISEPIEFTLEQIAEKFNVNVEQLKIKK